VDVRHRHVRAAPDDIVNGDTTDEIFLSRMRRARAVLYLDFDGVLQSEHVYTHPKRGIYLDQARAPGRTLFEWAPLLEAALLLAPDIKIVLSTTWARRPGFDKAMKRLPATVQKRVMGATYHSRIHGSDIVRKQSFIDASRGMQVWADVTRRKPQFWCALDDDTFGWPAWCRDNLIACNGEVGLSDPATYAALCEQLVVMQAKL
jgi:hypothetical protein